MARWDLDSLNSFNGIKLVMHTAYDHRFVNLAIGEVLPSLPRRQRACEFGAGYGRMSVALGQQFGEVVAFEREASLIEKASQLDIDDVEYINVDSLAKVPSPEGHFDFALTFTVLQHLTDEEVIATTTEMKRVASCGYILLVESHFEGYMHGEYGDGRYFTKGRTSAEYAELMRPFHLEFERPRRAGGSNGPIWGAYMMFRSPKISPTGGSKSDLDN